MSPQADPIWASLPIPLIVVGNDNCLRALNPAGEYFFNTAEASLNGQPISRFLNLDIDLAAGLARVRGGLAAIYHRDAVVERKGVSPTLCDVQLAPITGNDSDEAAVMVLLQPRQIAGQLDRAMHAKSVTNTAIGLSDMLAHEIKNPLAGINGAAQLLAMSLPAKDREMTDLIVAETHRIVDLLSQVEQFGDLRKPDFKPLNIHDVLERARLSAGLGTAAHMVFRDEYDPSLPLTVGDQGQLLQVFANLFANAGEAAPDGGTITIRSYYELGLRLSGSEIGPGGQAVPLQIEICDDGPGISDAMQNTVFEPFISGRENGTGLGLALVAKIVAEHHGSVAVSSKPGRTVFKISLPLAGTKNGAT